MGPRPPVRAAVHAEIQAFLGPEEKQIRGFSILNHTLGMGWNIFAVDQSLPRSPPVRRAVEVRLPIVAAVIVGHHVDLVWAVGTHVNEWNPRALWQTLELVCVVGPRHTAVCAVLKPSVVGAHPKPVGSFLRRRDAKDRTVVLRLRRVDGESPAGGLFKLGRVVGGQVRAQGFPSASSVWAVVHAVGPKIQAVTVVGVQRKGRVPRESKGRRVWRGWLDARGPEGRQVHPIEGAALVHGVHLAVACGLDVKPVAKQDLLPVFVSDATGMPHRGRSDPGTVVLHPSVHVVGLRIVDCDVVKLTHGKVVHKGPVVPAVAADVESPIVAVDEVIGVGGVNVQGVMIRVHPTIWQDDVKRAATVRRLRHHAPQAVDVVLVGRIAVDLGVVERTVSDVAVGGLASEGRAAVVRAVEGVVLRLHQGVDHVGVRRAHGQTHTSQLPFRQAVFVRALDPILAPVVGDIEAAAFAARGERPGLATERPHRREELVGVGGVHDEFRASGALIDAEDVVPRPSPVRGLVHATGGAVSPG